VPVKHKLGFGNGRIIEHEDGTAAYIATGQMTQAWRVPIAEVTGFSTIKGKKMLERDFVVLGTGGVIAQCSVGHGTAEVIEEWFRNHPLFRANQAASIQEIAALNEQEAAGAGAEQVSQQLIADELRKLADLHRDGALTDEEFHTLKTALIGRATGA